MQVQIRVDLEEILSISRVCSNKMLSSFLGQKPLGKAMAVLLISQILLRKEIMTF